MRRLMTLERLDDRITPAVTASFSVPQDWGSGFEGKITLANSGSVAITPWQLTFTASFTINSIWDASIVGQVGSDYTVSPATWNNSIPAGGSVSFGFTASPGASPDAPTNYRLNGIPLGGGTGPQLRVTGGSAAEGTSPAVFTITLSPAATSVVSVGYATQPGSADASDFTPTSGTLTFQPGETQKTVTVPIVPDDTPESNESLALMLNGAVGATILANSATYTIINDDFPPSAGYRVAAYYTEWSTYDRDYQVADVPAHRLTHLIYAFAQIDANGRVAIFDSYAAVEKMFPGDVATQPLKGNFHQLQKLKQAHPHLKTSIAVGGWTLSSPFSDVALTPASRANFAQSAVQFVRTYGFDGVDLDWEYPVGGGLPGNVTRPADKQNFTLLCQELRSQLDAAGLADGKRYELSAAVAAGSHLFGHYEPAMLAQYLDHFDVMTYDYHGGWESQTNHHAPLDASPADPNSAGGTFNVAWSINAYLAAGVPAHKLSMGLPLYNRAWQGVTAGTTHGLYRPASGLAPGTWEAGVIDYHDMHARLQTQPGVYQKYLDPVSGVPWVYAPTVAGGLFSTHEDTASILRKVNRTVEQRLGGVFFWDLSGDLPDSNADSLVRTTAEVLLQPTAKVSQVVVNDGSAQRSRVSRLTIHFDKVVTLEPGAFVLTGPGGVTIPLTIDTSGSTPNTTVARLDFAPLGDGRYSLRVASNSVEDVIHRPLDGNGDGAPGGDHVASFHRLFGDADGDAAVSAGDFLAFRLAFLSSLATFDDDADGVVGPGDFLAFRLRFLTTLP